MRNLVTGILVALAAILGFYAYQTSQKTGTLQTELATTAETVKALEEEKASLTAEVTRLQGQTDEAAKASTDAVAAMEAELGSLGETIAALEAEKATLADQVSALEAEKTALTGQVAALEAENTALADQAAALQAQLDAAAAAPEPTAPATNP